MNRRKFMLSSAGAAVALAMPGLIGRAVAAGAQEAKIDWQAFKGTTIDVLLSRHPWQEAIEPLVPDFEALTGITVRMTKLPEQQFITKVSADLTAGSFAFDAFMSQYYDAPKFQAEKWTAPLDGFLKDAKLTDPAWYDWQDFFPGARDIATIGRSYSDRIAITSEAQVLVYRKDVLEAAGVAVPDSFDTLLAAAAKIKEKGGGIFPITLRGGAANWWPLYGVVRSFGGDYLTPDLKSAIASPEAKAGLEAYAKLAAYAPPGITNSDWDEINTAMLSGQAAMFLDSSVIFGRLEDKKMSSVAGKVGVAPFPTGPGGRHGHSHYWSVSMANGSKKKEPAWLFLQWATSKPTQSALALKGVLGPRASAWQVDGLAEKFPPEFLSSVSRSLETAVISPANQKFFELMDPLRAATQEVILGNTTADKALDGVDAAWKKILG
jgi:ABC-type glycerol-3-phosphate transport system substrate-binding protein